MFIFFTSVHCVVFIFLVHSTCYRGLSETLSLVPMLTCGITILYYILKTCLNILNDCFLVAVSNYLSFESKKVKIALFSQKYVEHIITKARFKRTK